MEDLEIYFDDSYAEKYLLEEIERRQKKFWINKQGQRIDITKMDDSYLLNCLKFVRRQQELKQKELDDFYWEATNEIAEYGDR